MRKNNQEITDPRIIEEILSNATICRLGMLNEGRPYVLPFNYGYKDQKLYIHCAREGLKIEILKKDPEVCFEIEDAVELVTGATACDWTTTYRSIVGYGTVEMLTDAGEKRNGLKIIMEQHGASEPIEFEDRAIDPVLILCVHIDRMTAKKSGNWDRVHPVNHP
jgi:nitroimidazol reductase NimA-like FMN-containing flavoprotein (pyridoxamine 5'-phosphate oxidase superfamily)